MLKTLKEYKEVNTGYFAAKLCFMTVSGILIALYLPEYYRAVFVVAYFALSILVLRIIDHEEKYVIKLIFNSFIDKLRYRKHQ